MFKRRWSPRTRRLTSRTGKIPARKIPKSIARVRSEWVTVYNATSSDQEPGGTGCRIIPGIWAPVTIAGVEQCFSTFSFSVLTAQQLSDIYQDDVKIVQMVGDFWLKPVFNTINACDPDQVQDLTSKISNHYIRARGGLFKQRVVSTDLNVEGVVPHPLNGRDWSDAGFLKMWERNWVARPQELQQQVWPYNALYGVCPDVNRAQYAVPPAVTGTQPTYQVPAIQTTCNPATIGGEDCYTGSVTLNYHPPGWKKVSISSRKTIHMREDDNLTWFVDWASLVMSCLPEQPNSICGMVCDPNPPCGICIIPSLKMKVQYG